MHHPVSNQFPDLHHANVKNKTILLRLDLNVPMLHGQVTDDTRIQRSLASVRYLRNQGAKLVIISHFDRPKGRFVPAMSLAPLVDSLSNALQIPVQFGVDCIGDAAKQAIANTPSDGVVLLENLRFHAEEEANQAEFAQQLAELADIYVNDAFSCSHRAHASIVAITDYLPSYAGLLLQEELSALTNAIEHAKHPLMAIVGGAKISSKFPILDALVEKVDTLVIGGAMANSVLFALGTPIGASLYEADCQDDARHLWQKAQAIGCKLIIPTDVTVAKAFASHVPCRVCAVDDVQPDDMILDVGGQTAHQIAQAIIDSQSLVWNGPVGAFEYAPFDIASMSIARMIASRTAQGLLTSIAGGGDTLAALAAAGLTDQLSYISTAGGAFLEWLEGKRLPGGDCLTETCPIGSVEPSPECSFCHIKAQFDPTISRASCVG